MNNKIDFQLIEYPAGWKSIAAAWLTLFQQCSRPCGFYHPLFIEAAEVFPAHIAPTHIVLGYQGDVLVFGVPLRLENYWGFLKKISFFAGMYFAHVAPLDSTPGFAATQDFFAYIKSRYSPAVIQGSNVENEFTKTLKNIGAENRFKFFSSLSQRCLYLPLPDNQEELMNNFSKNLRHSLRNHLKRAVEAGIEFRVITRSQPGYNLVDAYDNMVRLKDARSESISRSSDYFIKTTVENYFKYICTRAENFHDLLMFAEAIHQGKVIASFFGFFTETWYYGVWHGFLPQYTVLSIGNLLYYKTMLALIDKKIPVFDFVMGEQSYKFRWSPKVGKDFNVIMGTTSFSSSAAFEWLCLQQSRERMGRLAWLKHRLLGGN